MTTNLCHGTFYIINHVSTNKKRLRPEVKVCQAVSSTSQRRSHMTRAAHLCEKRSRVRFGYALATPAKGANVRSGETFVFPRCPPVANLTPAGTPRGCLLARQELLLLVQTPPNSHQTQAPSRARRMPACPRRVLLFLRTPLSSSTLNPTARAQMVPRKGEGRQFHLYISRSSTHVSSRGTKHNYSTRDRTPLGSRLASIRMHGTVRIKAC